MKGRMACLLVLCLAMSCYGPQPRQGVPTSVPAAAVPLIDDFAYPSAAAAQEAWRPSEAARMAVSPLLIAGGHVLRLPCAFKAARLKRACWDHKVKLDLTACRGVQFQLYCSNARPISGFSFHLHSGDGWYSASFNQTTRRGWTTVTIDKTRTRAEGTPAGWGAIDTIRIAAWRNSEADTEFYLANLGLLGAAASIAIIRAESAAWNNPAEAGRAAEATQALVRMLDELGLAYTVISERDVIPARLKGKKILILPYNPRIPAPLDQALARFVQDGGKTLSFFIPLPPCLAQAAGIRTGPRIQERRSGQFALIRATASGLSNQPAKVEQRARSIVHVEPAGVRARVAALWIDARGRSTGEAAIVASGCAVHMACAPPADNTASTRQLVLAMLGHLAPELWEEAAQTALQASGKFGPFAGLDEALYAMQPATAGNPGARASLNEAAQARQEIQQLINERQYPKAMAKAGAARAAALRAWSRLQKPQMGERRLWWCEDPCGVDGMTWDEAIRNLADHGFTAIMPKMLGGGIAFYDSKVLPVAPEVKRRGDQLAQCLAACRKHGLECHAWKIAWNMSGTVAQTFARRMRREGRTQVHYDGTVNKLWLCPSDPANQQLEIDAMAEVATKYDVDGIHFDYIRYPIDEGCFCKGCRQRFEKALGHAVAHWPADTRKDVAIRQAWLDFRRGNITHVVAAVSARVRPLKPTLKISAAVYSDWADARDRIGQDWKLWCERGYLDFICPMDYTANAALFEKQVNEQLGWAGKVPVYPGIGLSAWNDPADAARLFEFIGITRRLKTGGFAVYSYSSTSARKVLPLCGAGITRKEQVPAPLAQLNAIKGG